MLPPRRRGGDHTSPGTAPNSLSGLPGSWGVSAVARSAGGDVVRGGRPAQRLGALDVLYQMAGSESDGLISAASKAVVPLVEEAAQSAVPGIWGLIDKWKEDPRFDSAVFKEFKQLRLQLLGDRTHSLPGDAAAAPPQPEAAAAAAGAAPPASAAAAGGEGGAAAAPPPAQAQQLTLLTPARVGKEKKEEKDRKIMRGRLTLENLTKADLGE
eukprot:gene12013-14947_t